MKEEKADYPICEKSNGKPCMYKKGDYCIKYQVRIIQLNYNCEGDVVRK